MAALTVRLDADLHDWLRELSNTTGVPIARLLAYALLEYRDKREREDTQHDRD